MVEAQPDLREPSPNPSIWSFISAILVSAVFIGSIFTPWALVWGLLPIAAALTAWFWPKRRDPLEEPVIG